MLYMKGIKMEKLYDLLNEIMLLIDDEDFIECKECVEKCIGMDDPMKSFECERECRELFE